MAQAKKRGAIKKFSGGILKYLPITATGPTGSEAYDEWIPLGYIQESTLSDVTETEDIVDETGDIVETDYQNRIIKLTGTLMQTDKDTLQFLKETCRDNYYSIFHYQGSVNGFHQEVIYGLCMIKPQVIVASGTKRPPFEITVLKNEAVYAYGGSGETDLPTDANVASTAIAAGLYYVIDETAV